MRGLRWLGMVAVIAMLLAGVPAATSRAGHAAGDRADLRAGL